MATERASDGVAESAGETDREGAGPLSLLWYGLVFGIGFLVFLAGAKNAFALYTGEAYAPNPSAYFVVAATFTAFGSVLVLYGLYGTVRTAVAEARHRG